ncbi:hypothetical protein CROQUDRAFT_657339 [Cronartium quercuum f. sp. fusiforme G11]|uniref:Uncharacterized protein n=1 Tax=Cronartium quercuum f. sp. fusiforme G11 TaxID=708437 RepID=A0A9P6NN53_9BASI|nr:hypothetical protein CROQUDRAFT_657339 [Cronartium quercuum f. sp. fusiforme G11]
MSSPEKNLSSHSSVHSTTYPETVTPSTPAFMSSDLRPSSEVEKEDAKVKVEEENERPSLVKMIRHERARRIQLEEATSELSRVLEERQAEVSQVDITLEDVQSQIGKTQKDAERLEWELNSQEPELKALKEVGVQLTQTKMKLKSLKAKLKQQETDREEDRSLWQEYGDSLKAHAKDLSASIDAANEQASAFDQANSTFNSGQPPRARNTAIDLWKTAPEVLKELSELRELSDECDAQITVLNRSLCLVNEEIEEIDKLYLKLSSQAPDTDRPISDPKYSLNTPERASKRVWERELAILTEENKSLRSYVNRLVSRIIDLEEFQVVLHRDFDSLSLNVGNA